MRLATLVEHGVLAREPYREPGRRSQAEYRLTEKGRGLLPVVVALMQWGDRWAVDAAGPPVEIRHAGCGALVHVGMECAAGHGGLTPRDTQARPGPGARRVA